MFKTVPTDYLERGFVALEAYQGNVVGSFSEEGRYVILRDLNKNQVLFKQSMVFQPHKVIIDHLKNRIIIHERYNKIFDS